MKTWMEAFIRRMRQAFGDRLAFVGLQGSRARGEATPKSDIDVVVVLDRLEADDIGAYRAALEELPEREKICGFFSGRAELAAWERSDLFQFVHDTIPFYGDLSAITPPLSREDARRAALTGACNIIMDVCTTCSLSAMRTSFTAYTRRSGLPCAQSTSGRRARMSPKQTSLPGCCRREKRAC